MSSVGHYFPEGDIFVDGQRTLRSRLCLRNRCRLSQQLFSNNLSEKPTRQIVHLSHVYILFDF